MGSDRPMDLSNLDTQTALDIARNADGAVDPRVKAKLDYEFEQIWLRLSAQPDSYLLSKDEFALFNYYIYTCRHLDANLTQQAVARFWGAHQGQDGA